MLRSIKDLESYKIEAKDGDIGKVYDFFFDDVTWTVRYLAADTGTWLPGKRVLISPYSLGTPNWSAKLFPVNLTQKQIENSPDIDEHRPFERQRELEVTQYYGWPNYWSGISGAIVGGMPVPERNIEIPVDESDHHLHSAKSIINYNVHGTDDSIGHVEDFIVDDTNWNIRYLIVDTHNWLPGGRKVIISPRWIKSMKWTEASVHIDLTKDQIKNSPEWDPSVPIQSDYETKLHDFYGKKIFW